MSSMHRWAWEANKKMYSMVNEIVGTVKRSHAQISSR